MLGLYLGLELGLLLDLNLGLNFGLILGPVILDGLFLGLGLGIELVLILGLIFHKENNMKEVEFTIKTDGTIEIDLINFKGKGCKEVGDLLAEGLGKKSKSDIKGEFYKQDACAKQKIKR